MQNTEKEFKIVIIDATNFFIRYFSADSKSLDTFGFPCGGLSGTLKGLRNLLKDLNPNEIIMVFDGKDNSKRKQKIDEQYKQGKKYSFIEMLPQENKTLFNKQMAKLLLVLKYLPIKIFTVDNVEADDVIGYVVHLLNKRDENIDINIISSDADFQQLLSENVRIYDTRKKEFITQNSFIEANGFYPQNYHIFKTFAGESKSKDNVPRILVKKKIIGYFDEILNRDQYTTIEELEDFILSNDIPVDLDRVKKNYNLVNLHSPNISTDTKLQIGQVINNYENKIYGLLNIRVQLKTFGIDGVVYTDFIDYLNRYKMRNNTYTKFILSEIKK